MRLFRHFFALQHFVRFSFGKYPLQAVEWSPEVPYRIGNSKPWNRIGVYANLKRKWST